MISETLQPIKKAAALTRALAVASSKMNTTSVLGDTLASRPSSARMMTVLMGVFLSAGCRCACLLGSTQQPNLA
jgi:hypothetical protein